MRGSWFVTRLHTGLHRPVSVKTPIASSGVDEGEVPGLVKFDSKAQHLAQHACCVMRLTR